MRANNLKRLIIWIVLFEVIGFFLGLLTQANLDPWYDSLNKSALTPPGILFSIVWPLLYVLLAFIASILSNSSQSIIYIYTLQMLMNWAWTPLFFQCHWINLSAFWLIALTCLNVILIALTKNKQKIIAFLLIPYVLWLGFASYLNVAIAFMN